MFTVQPGDMPREDPGEEAEAQSHEVLAQGHTQGGSCLPVWCPCYCLSQGVSESSSWTQRGQQAEPWSPGADRPLGVRLLEFPG